MQSNAERHALNIDEGEPYPLSQNEDDNDNYATFELRNRLHAAIATPQQPNELTA